MAQQHNTYEQFYRAQIHELLNHVRDLTNNVGNLSSVCNERHKMDFCSEVKLLHQQCESLKKDVDDLDKSIKENANSIASLKNQMVELNGQLNSAKLSVDELLFTHDKKRESNNDFWRQVVILILSAIVISMAAWIGNTIFDSFKDDLKESSQQEQVIHNSGRSVPSFHYNDESLINNIIEPRKTNEDAK